MKLYALVLLFFIGELTYANNNFIPNYYKSRREMNSGSALAWSARREAGVQIATGNAETSGRVQDEETKSFGLKPYLFYRTPSNLNVEAEYTATQLDEKNKVTGTEEGTDTHILKAGIGFELPEAPIAISALLTHSKYDFDGGDNTKQLGGTVSAGYALPDQIYLGASVTHDRTDSTYTNRDDNDTTYSLGVGMVLGERANPEGAFEGVVSFYNEERTHYRSVTLRGLINLEALQPYAELEHHEWDTSSGKNRMSAFTLGLDYEMPQGIYLAPELYFNQSKYYDDDRNEGINVSLEAGYRIPQSFEGFVRYTNVKSEWKNSDVTSNDYDTKGATWIVGGAYFF